MASIGDLKAICDVLVDITATIEGFRIEEALEIIRREAADYSPGDWQRQLRQCREYLSHIRPDSSAEGFSLTNSCSFSRRKA